MISLVLVFFVFFLHTTGWDYSHARSIILFFFLIGVDYTLTLEDRSLTPSQHESLLEIHGVCSVFSLRLVVLLCYPGMDSVCYPRAAILVLVQNSEMVPRGLYYLLGTGEIVGLS